MDSQGAQRQNSVEQTSNKDFNSCTHKECNEIAPDLLALAYLFQFMHSQGVQPQHLANML